MAEELGAISATKKQSIARVELFTDASLAEGDRRLVIHFEDGLYDANDVLIGETTFGTRRVERRFGDIAAVEITAAGMSVSVAQLAALIQVASYQFRQEDIDAAVEQSEEEVME